MSLATNVNQAIKALEVSRAKGSHSVRVGADLLEMLINSNLLLQAAFLEIDKKVDNEG